MYITRTTTVTYPDTLTEGGRGDSSTRTATVTVMYPDTPTEGEG